MESTQKIKDASRTRSYLPQPSLNVCASCDPSCTPRQRGNDLRTLDENEKLEYTPRLKLDLRSMSNDNYPIT